MLVQGARRAPLPQLGEVLDFMRLIWGVDHALQRTSKRMEAALGVTGPQRLIIRVIGRFPGITAGALAEILDVHASTLTGAIKRLERGRLLRRRADPADGRRVQLELTERGRSFDVETEGTIEAAVERSLRRAPRAKVAAAREVLALVADALDELERRRRG